MKSAPKGNFNCLTQPGFLMSVAPGGEEREAALRGNKERAAAEKGDHRGEIPAPASEELPQKGLRG